MTAELYPLLEKYASANGDARIVNHSSGGRHMTPKGALERKYFEKNGGNLGGDADGPRFFSGPKYERYFQTKLANAVFTKALHNKLSAKHSKVRAICADPGMSATNLGDHLFSEGDGAATISAMGESDAMMVCGCDSHDDFRKPFHS